MIRVTINKREVRPCQCSAEACDGLPVAPVHWNGHDITAALDRRHLLDADTLEVEVIDDET